jgi:hypothetical protein
MSEAGARLRIAGVAVAVLGIGIGIGYWQARPPAPAPAASDAPARAPAAPPPAAAPEAPAAPAAGAPAPVHRISDKGRISVALDDLREGDVYALGLDMPDEMRGQGDRPVKVIDVKGRVFETTSVAIAGAGGGVRIEIDPEWLAPGRYMIQVETAEKRPMALRRYVLEVR